MSAIKTSLCFYDTKKKKTEPSFNLFPKFYSSGLHAHRHTLCT